MSICSGGPHDYLHLLPAAGNRFADGTTVLGSRRLHLGSLSVDPGNTGLSAARKALFDNRIKEAQTRFEQQDSRYFANTLPARHQWRLDEWLRERALYLDTETDSFGQITVVGLYGRGRYTALVRQESLSLLRLQKNCRSTIC